MPNLNYLGQGIADSLLRIPSVVPFATSLTLDVGAKDLHLIQPLTNNLVIAFSNIQNPCDGAIWLKQDAIGGRILGITTPLGYIVIKTMASINPAPAANAITIYPYRFATLGGTNYLFLDKYTPT